MGCGAVGGWMEGAGNGIWSVKNELQIKLNLKKKRKKSGGKFTVVLNSV